MFAKVAPVLLLLGLWLGFSIQGKTDELPRYALVIGNQDYQFLPKLDNPLNDAQDMGQTLAALGFQVAVHLNADQETMEDAIVQFGNQLMSGGVGLFYYAGHGVQFNGIHYLIPVDANITEQKHFKYKAVNLAQVFDELTEANNRQNIVILDACRDNPLQSFSSPGRGFVKAEEPAGTLIAFATAPDSPAADGRGDNGLYTKHLLTHMRTPGLSLEKVFAKVAEAVMAETAQEEQQQIPWISSSFTGDFYFIAPQGDVTLIQSPGPIEIHSDPVEKTPWSFWLGIATFLLLSGSLGIYIYQRQPVRAEVTGARRKEKRLHQPSAITMPPDIDEHDHPEAVGYLINQAQHRSVAAILPNQRLILGRSKRRANVYLDDDAISSEHAALSYHVASRTFVLEDLHSSNGTWIEGQAPLSAGVKVALKVQERFYLAHQGCGFWIANGNKTG